MLQAVSPAVDSMETVSWPELAVTSGDAVSCPPCYRLIECSAGQL